MFSSLQCLKRCLYSASVRNTCSYKKANLNLTPRHGEDLWVARGPDLLWSNTTSLKTACDTNAHCRPDVYLTSLEHSKMPLASGARGQLVCIHSER